jgi:hypothetical protein
MHDRPLATTASWKQLNDLSIADAAARHSSRGERLLISTDLPSCPKNAALLHDTSAACSVHATLAVVVLTTAATLARALERSTQR